MITKKLLQTAKEPLPSYVTDQMRTWLGNDWKLIVLTNEQMRDYLINNPIEGFERIVEKFDEFKGAHKADLFRYYWLWQNGGVYLDSDIMLTVPIERFVQNEEFVSAYNVSNICVCNGILGTVPKHPIIWEALLDAYNTNVKILEDNYFHFCQNLKAIVDKESKIRMYQERQSPNFGVFETFDPNDGTILLYHFTLDKRVYRFW
jgi:mannosyltransferase OCH1-like enzyme